MSPPPDNEETGGTNPMPMLPNDPNAQPPRPLSPVGFLDILRDSRVLALLLTALFGGPAVTGTVLSYNGDAQNAPITEALDEQKSTDERILEKLDDHNAKLGEVDNRVSDIVTEQRAIKVSINGDPTSVNKPGIKGLLRQHERKLNSLRKDVIQIKKRDGARDDETGMSKKLDRTAPLERDEVWDP